MKKIIISLSTIALVAVAGFGATRAYFSSTATSANNTFQSATMSIGLANTSYTDARVLDGRNMYPGSFVEYGAFAIASQRTRRTIDDLIEHTPADGLITGIGRVNGSLFGPERSRVAIAHYDYTVLAGTQGKTNFLSLPLIKKEMIF